MPRYRPSTNAKKVSNRQMRRYAQEAINAGHRAVLVLISVLAQKGGEVTVTQTTLDQCGRRLQNLNYEVVPVEGRPEFIVRLVGDGVVLKPAYELLEGGLPKWNPIEPADLSEVPETVSE